MRKLFPEINIHIVLIATEIIEELKPYEEYIKLQKTKTLNLKKRNTWLSDEWEIKLKYFEKIFSDLIFKYNINKKSKSLCLGARTGQEVQAFINLEIESIGIDIVPNEPLVIYGDIHDIPFDNHTFDLVFTNIVDHSLYQNKLISETEKE